MSPVTRWTFRGAEFVVNPMEDSGWIKEEKAEEVELLDADTTVIQSSGFRSETRTIRGWILSAAFYNTLKGWLGQTGTLTDDIGGSATARLMSFEAERVRNVADWNTWRYTATWMKR